MKAQFEAGEGRQFNGTVNYIWYREDGYSLYAEIQVPEGASDDYGYLTLKQAILKALEEKGISTDIEFWYDGQEQFLDPDAAADGDVFCEVETPWYGEPEFKLYHVVDRPDGDGAGDWFDIIETNDRDEALKAAEKAWSHMSAHDRKGRVVQVEEWHDEMGNADIIIEYK